MVKLHGQCNAPGEVRIGDCMQLQLAAINF